MFATWKFTTWRFVWRGLTLPISFRYFRSKARNIVGAQVKVAESIQFSRDSWSRASPSSQAGENASQQETPGRTQCLGTRHWATLHHCLAHPQPGNSRCDHPHFRGEDAERLHNLPELASHAFKPWSTWPLQTCLSIYDLKANKQQNTGRQEREVNLEASMSESARWWKSRSQRSGPRPRLTI